MGNSTRRQRENNKSMFLAIQRKFYESSFVFRKSGGEVVEVFTMDNKAQSSMKRRDGISPDREVKRLRPTEVDNPPTLSPDLFAKILECEWFVCGLCV